jgi:very-short-patch-repair endonuclease
MTTDRARLLRRNLTDAERTLWQSLRNRRRGDRKFRRQVPIGRYIVDFLCEECRLILEIDGGQHAQSQGYDDARTRYLNTCGYHVLRFWNTDVLENLEGVLTVILAETARPSPGAARRPLPRER